MSYQQLVNGKAEISPILIDHRNPFNKVYQIADDITQRSEYIWSNRRQMVVEWNYDRQCYELLVRSQSHWDRVVHRFTATKQAISDWSRKLNTTLASDVWTIVSFYPDGEDIPVALAVLTDKYAILKYTDIVSSIEKIMTEFTDDINVNMISMSPYHMNVDVSMSDMAISTELAEVGDIISAGVRLKSSLTGNAAVWIGPYVMRLDCKNGVTISDPKHSSSERFVHRWGGMQYDLDNRPVTQTNTNWLKKNASKSLGWKYKQTIRKLVYANFQDSVEIVKGASVAASTPATGDVSRSIVNNIIDTWLTESKAQGIDHRKKDFEYLSDDRHKADFKTDVIAQLEIYGNKLGYSMYSVIQALTERKILRELPEDVAEAVEDWAGRYCLFLSEKYTPDKHRIERIPSSEVEELLKGLR